jgi:putative ubiquitin-RnfH superfamily antitoxin RatB of RatAB toxin-antitoxin module
MTIQVVVAYAPEARKVMEVTLQLPVGATVAQALQASGLAVLYPALDLDQAVVGIWGRKAGREHALREGDRVEIYRPLRVDPKTARRERFAKQGARTTGLFARKRAGAKSGY